jgi:lysophospholipase L1-like esterase
VRAKLAVLYANLSLFCVLLVGLEVGGQILFYLLKGYPVYATVDHPEGASVWHRQLLEQHPYLVGRLRSEVRAEQKGKVVTTTAIHTRWTGAPADQARTVRVVTMGGSTTFGAGVSDSETWPARLQALLGPGYSVTNYGLLGYSTAEGIVQMGLLVPESQPDIVVFYEGWNDIRNYHDPQVGADYFDHGMSQYSTLNIELPTHLSPFMRLANVSAIFRFALVLAQPHATATSVTAPGDIFDDADSTVDRLYLRNLRTLHTLTAQLGAYALFVPQVLNQQWYTTHQGSDWWTPHVDNRAMPVLLQRLNHIMEDACTPGGHDCVVLNGISSEPWEPADFLDEGHFTVKGNDAFARIVADRVRGIAAARPALVARVPGPVH